MGELAITTNIASLDVMKLDEGRKQQVYQIKDNMVLSPESTLNFGTDVHKHLSAFSTQVLTNVKLKDMPDVEGFISELLVNLDKVDANSLLEVKQSWFRKFTKSDNLKQFIAKYEDVNGLLGGVKMKLEQCNLQLRKDIDTCSKFLEQNMMYINELDNYIIAGKLKYDEESVLLEEKKKDINADDLLSVYEIKGEQEELDRLERKLYNLLLIREVAIQNITQLRLIRELNSKLIEEIQISINTAIPMWESQMVIAIHLLREKGALAIQQSVRNTTNKILEQNSALLRSGSIEIAKELEEGVVDINVLKNNTTNLVKVLEDINKIRSDGKKKREEVIVELSKLQTKLNEQVLLSVNN